MIGGPKSQGEAPPRKYPGMPTTHHKKRRGQKHYEVQHMPHAEFKEHNPVEFTEHLGEDGKVHKTFRKPGSVSVNRRGSGGRDELRALKEERRLAKKEKRLARRAAG